MKTLSVTEQKLAEEHHIKLHQNLIIFDAQPPISDDIIQKIEARLLGSIPPELIALWRVSFGGEMLYDCRIKYEGYHISGSFQEIYYPNSNHYHDLWGWIDHEVELFQELSDERGTQWSGKLDVLPFAGFEYHERFYIVVAPEAKDYGAVLCWREAFHAFPGSVMAQDALTTVATNLTSFFEQFTVECIPNSGDNPYAPSEFALEHLEVLAEKGEKQASLAAKLETIYNSKLVHWREALTEGKLSNENYMLVIALERAARNNDVDLLKRLYAAGCDLDTPLHGNFSALTYALNAHSFDSVRYLLDKNVDVQNANHYLSGKTPDDIKNIIRLKI